MTLFNFLIMLTEPMMIALEHVTNFIWEFSLLPLFSYHPIVEIAQLKLKYKALSGSNTTSRIHHAIFLIPVRFYHAVRFGSFTR